jgi:hypothetical protein
VLIIRSLAKPPAVTGKLKKVVQIRFLSQNNQKMPLFYLLLQNKDYLCRQLIKNKE